MVEIDDSLLILGGIAVVGIILYFMANRPATAALIQSSTSPVSNVVNDEKWTFVRDKEDSIVGVKISRDVKQY